MITLVSPPLGEGQAGFDGLTAAARRTLGSEAIVIVFEPGTRPPVVVAAEGLAASELAGLERGLSDSGDAYLRREFEGVLSADVVHDGERLGAIHALKRDGEPFENADLIANFSVQVAIAFGLRRRPAAAGLAPERDETLGELDQLVLSVHSLEDLSGALARVIAPLFDGAISGLMVADAQRNVLQMIPGSFGADREVAASHQVSIFDPRSNSARVFTTGQPHLSNTSEEDAGIRQEYVNVFGIHRLLTVPLRQVGVLHIANKADRFTIADVERALALAPRIASVVELATTLFRLRRQQRLEGILARVAVAVASGSDAHDFLVPALQELCEVTEASLLAIVPDDGPPILARRGQRDVRLEQTVLEEAGDEPGIRAYVVGPQKAGDPGWAAFYVPVYLSRQRMGTLAAYRLRGEPFARADRRALARMANLAALARATERYQHQRAELARMQERQRIADDLHDDVAQILFAAQLSLDGILQRGGLDEDAVSGIARARGLLIRGDTAIRTVIHRLSSPPAADIGTRLASVVSSVEDEFSVAARLVVEEDAAARARDLRRPVSDALVKVAREALVNAAKHAGPCHVDVRLELARGDRLRLTVEDDGCGRVAAAAAAAAAVTLDHGSEDGDAPDGGEHHHGLLALRRSIREQDGTLRVTRGADGGTRVAASVPLTGLADATVPPAHVRT